MRWFHTKVWLQVIGIQTLCASHVCTCLHVCVEMQLLSASVCISDQFAEASSPHYCQLFPFWANHTVNHPTEAGRAHLSIKGWGPSAEDDSTDMNPFYISHPSSWPKSAVAACRTKPDGSLRRTILPATEEACEKISLLYRYHLLMG